MHNTYSVLRTARTMLAGRLRDLTKIAILLAFLLTTGSYARAQDTEPLRKLNETFREAHTKARTVILEGPGPVIIVEFDDLVLYRDGGKKYEKVTLIPPLYHRLKAIAHSP